ncbi:MAG: excinuclease ABC subunit UvrC, partial [Clostridia bacterium]|nr:excinuclease ABC subunit UvrC [Clostridia bacterium]
AEGWEIDLHANPAVFALIGQIQDETHRFAITFHHESHSKSTMHSALDDIPGVGKTRKAALLKAFRSVKAIREADMETLEKVVPKNTAKAVWEHFHLEKTEDQ